MALESPPVPANDEHVAESPTSLDSRPSFEAHDSESPSDSAPSVQFSEPGGPTAQRRATEASLTSVPLPLPASIGNKPKGLFKLLELVPDISESFDGQKEVVEAEFSVALDKTFVDTASGAAARELKRRWDLQIGLSRTVRSPYAITAFVNQHGKQMFRVGRRDLSAPAANAAQIEDRMTLTSTGPDASVSPRNSRRSRMSMNAIFTKNGAAPINTKAPALPQGQVPRKLRKTRSIPDMVGQGSFAEPTSVGRAHSKSVTGADIAPFATIIRHEFPPSDIFADSMGWLVPPPTPGSSYSTPSQSSSEQYSNGHHDYLRNQLRISHPFGHGISYESPSNRYAAVSSPQPLAAPMPRHLREMQSFESGLTARQEDTPVQPAKAISPTSRYSLDPVDLGRPLSAMRLHSPGDTTSNAEDTPTTPSPAPVPQVTLALPPETNSVSRYSTDVFDVLQTYRGLPQIDKLSLEKGDTTFKMSLSADESAAPRDDPRFVIWGESHVDRDGDDHSVSHESLTDSSIHSSSISRRRMSRAKPQEVTPVAGTEEMHRILLAATIERWIAQLTSDLSYEELLDFFLTYRTYVSAVDLCHLLICRFQWSLLQPTSAHDEKVRRIVRVRTFVAIRFWILTFFTADFIPNRDLRLLFGDWLNTLIRDPILKKHTDGVGIVRKLMKVAKDCREQHIKIPTKARDRSSSVASKSSVVTKPHILGERFAAAVQKTAKEDEESDVDLDFLPEEGKNLDDSRNILTEAPSSGYTPTRPTSLPASSQSILQHTDLAPMTIMEPDTPYVQASSLTPPLPMQHNAISRVIVRTIGRLGRWKRVLNSRATVKPVPGSAAAPPALEVEATETKGLLTVDPQNTKARPPLKPDDYSPPTSPPSSTDPPPEEPTESNDTLPLDESQVSTTAVDTDASSMADSSFGEDEAESDDRPVSFRSTSTDSFGRPLTAGGPAPLFPGAGRSQWGFDVVSIDDLDFSDTSSILDPAPPAPPGLRKLPKKLPLRREFEFVKRPETVSSLGIRSTRSSVASDRSSASSGIALGGAVAQWQLNALVDSLSDDEEAGDVEDALKRLEGQVNPQRQQEKASKVDGWVRNIQKRMATGDYDDVPPRFSDDEEDYEDDDDDDESPQRSQDGGSESRSERSSVRLSFRTPFLSAPKSEEGNSEESVDMVKTPVPTQTSHFPGSESDAPLKAPEANPPPREVVPREIWQSRLPSRPSTADSNVRPSFSRLTLSPPEPRWMPSFIFTHRAAEVAEHFAMIDRDLFMAIGFEELFQDWWTPNEIDVLDWEQFLRDRTRWKAEGRFPHKTSVLGAVRARFNVMANFTVSEIVQAPPTHRALLVGKFIRVAWRSYCMSSFATLVAIIAGLSSEWVARAMRKPGWHRVGMWEKRMLKDLKLFTDSKDDFRYLRHNITAIVDAKGVPPDPAQSTASMGAGPEVTASGKGKVVAERPPISMACIPFIGVYLSQLKRAQQLPDVIDPTAPEEPIGLNAITFNLETPSQPEVFSALAPLPEGMNLEPLINVQKQRRVAGVIKSLVAAQHVASRIQFDVDKKLFQKCLKLSGLGPQELQRILAQRYLE